MISSKRRFFLKPAFGLMVLFLATLATGENWSEPTSKLAHDIAGVATPGAIALSLKNNSSLTSAEVTTIRRSLETGLRAAGFRMAEPGGAVPEVEITLSENLDGYLWVAAIRQGTETHVVMRAVPKLRAGSVDASTKSVSLHKVLLWSQSSPILDVAVIENGNGGPRLLVLDPEKLTLLRGGPGHWEQEWTSTIVHARPFPRDIRGRLEAAGEQLWRAYLPGTTCEVVLGPQPSSACKDGDEPWPLQAGEALKAHFEPTRNFFSGGLTPDLGKQSSAAAFYSAAGLPRADRTLWLFAGTDGRVRAWDGVTETVMNAARSWGSDIVAVRGNCGTLVLAASNGDQTVSDSVSAYEVADRDPAAISQPLEFPGPLGGLWNSPRGNTANAMTHNLRNNQYEAYSVAVVCP